MIINKGTTSDGGDHVLDDAFSIEVFDRLEHLDPYVDAWDELAVAGGQPLARPGWVCSWWRAHEQEGNGRAHLRIVVVTDALGLAAVAPLVLEVGRGGVVTATFLGHGLLLGGQPLVRREGAEEAAARLTEAIASLTPRPNIVRFAMIDAQSIWPRALTDRWPGATTWVGARHTDRAYLVQVAGSSFEAWAKSRGAKWWSDVRRRTRRFEEVGGVVRRAEGGADALRALDGLIRLHRLHWSDPDPLTPQVVGTLTGGVGAFEEPDAVRLWTAEVEGQVVGASLLTTAGGVGCFFMTAYDRAWSRYAPGRLAMVAGIKEAFDRHDDVVDLMYGDFGYKAHLSTDTREVIWCEVFPRTSGYRLARAVSLPRHGRQTLHRIRKHVRVRTRLRALLGARRRVPGATATW